MKKLRLMLSIFNIAFLLNLLWENAQAPLYEDYTNFWDHFMPCFWASLADAAVILLMYLLLTAWYKDFYWIEYLNWKAATAIILIGGAVAIGFEHWAHETDAWAYTEKMPVVPYLQVGLSPLLQMMSLPLLTFIISYKIVPAG